jgi:hypothetical protein
MRILVIENKAIKVGFISYIELFDNAAENDCFVLNVLGIVMHSIRGEETSHFTKGSETLLAREYKFRTLIQQFAQGKSSR